MSGVTAQIILALRPVQDDWLEDVVAANTRAHSHQCQCVLRATQLVLQLSNCQAKLRAGETVWEDKGSIALLRERLCEERDMAYYYHVRRSRYAASQPQPPNTELQPPAVIVRNISVSG